MDPINLIIGAVAGLAMWGVASSEKKENYFGAGPAQTVRAQAVEQSTNGMYSLPGQYQAMIPPRMNPNGYGAYINYNMPNTNMLAADPKNPMMQRGVPTVLTEGYHDGQQHVGSMLASNNQGGEMVNAFGELNQQPVVYNRLIFANQKSRLNSLGDPLRGDLPIQPINTGWFQPSISPNIDLKSGSLMAMGGINNETSKQLQALRSASAAGAISTGGGVNFIVQKSPYTSMNGRDVQVSAFP
jgi:hypothetical protein